ncbi:hypothetical protein HBH98_243930 [Parastagonospora nodorum]|nr:hypothetical protein HBH53_230620 [Parastagonospora nodorum]KAH3956365.1 hypothetical protein HBH51_243970 [Parastagonospora nodorum]KAH4215526.1 hypothetical protein HBI06_248020 [Parastagonospora nodorum]KAH4224221.1 hypothetical protein HBI05_242160 [Parastagonospora nodorum]KAH4334258.1 hypothetical protein HBH98_243930 [Parastagonospora nodorum]
MNSRRLLYRPPTALDEFDRRLRMQNLSSSHTRFCVIADRTWAQLARVAAAVELEGACSPAPRKRARAASDADDTEGGAEGRIATVTNHNRRAEHLRKVRRAKADERRQECLGLAAPGSQAPVAERNAHRSITPTDETEVAWIVKQPTPGNADFFHTAKLLYTTANTMLQYARAVGNDAAKVHASYFVDKWRRSGHALLLANASTSAVSSRPSATPARRSNFDILIEAVSQCESIYRDEIARIQREDDAASLQSGRRESKGQLHTQAKRALWDRYRPDVHNGLTWSAFKVRLKREQRWTDAAAQLEWGFLLLIPTSMITSHWAKQTLRAAEWSIWLQLVNRGLLIMADVETWDAGIKGSTFAERYAFALAALARANLQHGQTVLEVGAGGIRLIADAKRAVGIGFWAAVDAVQGFLAVDIP